MDITPYQELKIAPRAVFDSLPERRSRVRFMIPNGSDWRSVTWGAFAKGIEQVALFLSTVELRVGDRAAVFAPNSVEWITAALGIQAAGGVMVPIYPASTAEQAAYVVSHSDAQVVFVDSAGLLARVLEAWGDYGNVRRIVLLSDSIDVAKVLEDARSKGAKVPAFAEVERKIVPWSRALSLGAHRGEEEPALFLRTMHAVSLDQPGMMLYTSGTSGQPKGVPLTHRNVGVNGLDWLRNNASLVDENAVDLLWLPMSHIFGFGEACLGNTLGFTSYLCDPTTVLKLLPEVHPQIFMSVPAYWEKLAMAAMAEEGTARRHAKLREITGGKLRFCLSGGAGLKREVKEFFHEAGLLIIEGYGLTEASPTLTLNRPDAFRFDSVGKPLPSVELKLAEDGEILARGASIFGGYHKDPAATTNAFTEDGWLKTGDVGRWTEDGFLQIIDRKKDILVTSGGKNVPPANIEVRFCDDPFIAHLVVYGDGKSYLTAGVWLNEAAVNAQLDSDGVAASARPEAVKALVQRRLDRVNASLPSYETLKKFAVIAQPLTVANGLLTPTLKVKRKKVYETFKTELEALYR
ncbi:MAG: AMP-dependent synthetase/ligase [Myxococcaceae bacterium]